MTGAMEIRGHHTAAGVTELGVLKPAHLVADRRNLVKVGNHLEACTATAIRVIPSRTGRPRGCGRRPPRRNPPAHTVGRALNMRYLPLR